MNSIPLGNSSLVTRWLTKGKFNASGVRFNAFMPKPNHDMPGEISVNNISPLSEPQIWDLCDATFPAKAPKRADLKVGKIFKIETDNGFLEVDPAPYEGNDYHCNILVPGIETREDLLDEAKHQGYAQKLANISKPIARP